METRALLDDPNVPALYEAALSYDDVAVRADIIARQHAREFDLIEVKSTASWKEAHLFDVAVQLYVLEGAGSQVGQACLMHLNRDYLYQGGAYDLEQLFTCVDLTEQVLALRPKVAAALAAMRQPLWAHLPPPIATGPHCTAPYVCPFYDHCHGDRPEHPIEELPGRRARILQELAELGIADIRDIPHDFDGLTVLQRRVRDAVRAGSRYHDPAIAAALAKAQFPVHFVDFETFTPNFHGSFSIKAVLPALVPHLGYDDLEIGDGLLASLACEELRNANTTAARAAELRANLLAYCRRDTEAILELFRALR